MRKEIKQNTRNVWADTIQSTITARRLEFREAEIKLNEGLSSLRSQCNHTFKNGISSLEQRYDEDDDCEYSWCLGCESCV